MPRLRRKLAAHAEALRYEDAARLRDRIAALEAVAAELERLERLRARASSACSSPAAEAGFRRAFFVARGRVAAARTVPPGAGARARGGARRGAPRRALARAEDADELLLVAQFLAGRRPSCAC